MGLRRDEGCRCHSSRTHRVGAHRPRDVLDALFPHGVEGVGPLVADVVTHGSRDADPTRLCQRLQTRRDIHTVTEEVVLLNSSLAAIYHHQGRLTEEIGAWERASALLPYPALELLALGYAELAARRPQRALQEFEKAALSLPPGRERQADERFFASLARGRATALSAIGQQR